MAKPPKKPTPGKTPAGTRKPDAAKRGLVGNLRTSRGRSPASQLWLKRQLNDPYVALAQAQGWRSRAAFKLIEIDDRYHLIRPGMRVLGPSDGFPALKSDRGGTADTLARNALPASSPRVKLRAIQK